MDKTRARRTVEEKCRIVELTLRPGASVAGVARSEGVNANQVFQWRRAYRKGELPSGSTSTALLPVVIAGEACSLPVIASDTEAAQVVQDETSPKQPAGAIHIELPGRAVISVEHGADHALLRTVLESLRQ